MNTLQQAVQQLQAGDSLSFHQSLVSQAISDLKQCTDSKRIDIDLTQQDVQQQLANALAVLADQFKLPLTLFAGLQDTYLYGSTNDVNAVEQQVQQYHARTCKVYELTNAVMYYIDAHVQAYQTQQHEHQQQFATSSASNPLIRQLFSHLKPALTNLLLHGVLQYQTDVQQIKLQLQYSVQRDEADNTPYAHLTEWITTKTRSQSQQLFDALQQLFAHMHVTDDSDSAVTSIMHYFAPHLYKQKRADLKAYDTQYINEQLTAVNQNIAAVKSQMKHQPAPWLKHPSFRFIVYALIMSTSQPHMSAQLQSIVPLTLSLIDDTHSMSRLLGLRALQHVVNNTNRVEYMWYSNVILHVIEHQLQQRDVEVLEVLIPLYVDLVMLTYPATTPTQRNNLSVDTDGEQRAGTQAADRQRTHHFAQLLNELDYHTLSPQHKYTIATRIYVQQMMRLIVYMGTSIVQYFERLLPIVFTLSQQSTDLPTRTAALQCIVMLLHTVTQRMLRHAAKTFEHCIQLYLSAGARYSDIEYFDSTVTDVNDNLQQRQAWRQTQLHSIQLLLLLKEKMLGASSKVVANATVTWQELSSNIDGMDELREVTEATA